MSATTYAHVDRQRLAGLIERERRRFADEHPRSCELYAETSKTLLGGVPMSWMTMWAGGFPLFFAEAKGAGVVDVDGLRYVDFCLGDTGAMAGHAPEPTARAVERQIRSGTTVMLPSEDAAWVGRELVRRLAWTRGSSRSQPQTPTAGCFGWRGSSPAGPRSLVFNYCYHGTVDESVDRARGRLPRSRPGNVGPAVDPTVTTKVIEFNDLAALEQALAPGDVAAVLAEPALTNIGIVLPDPGYHEGLREITRRTGTLLIIDETHTMSTGPGGYTAAHGLDPDILTVGKSIAGGVPIGAYGMRRELADRILAADVDLEDVGGVGGTLAGNALSMAAARATLARGADRRGVRAHDPARRALYRRRPGRARLATDAVEHRPDRRPR